MTTLASVIAVTLGSGVVMSTSVNAGDTFSRPPQVVSSHEAAGTLARYTVVLNDEPLASYQGQPVKLSGTSQTFAVAPRTARGRIDVNSAQATSYVQALQQKQQDFVQQAAAEFNRPLEAELKMQHAINAVVLELTEAEAGQLRQRADVRMVNKEHMETLLTDRGPSFIGADTIWNGTSTGGVMSQGEGMVVAELDTGIAWDSPSFAATGSDGYSPVNPLGSGVFLGLCNPAATAHADATPVQHCNNKLIGMYNFLSTSTARSGADDEGHGSHTASTAAGNHRSASYIGGTFNISGVAPHANVVAYKVCAAGAGATCTSTASTGAANQAVADGIIDAINYSIGGGTDPWSDPTSLAFLGAVNAGIFVAAAAGNDGPAVSTTGHIEPWVMTAAASTEDRVIAYPFNLTAPIPVPANAQNLAVRPGSAPLPTVDLVNTPVIQSPNFSDGSNDGCAAYPAGTFLQGATPAIAVLRLNGSASNCGSGARKTAATNAGAIGVIFVDTSFLNLGASGNAWSMLLSDWNNVFAQVQTNPTAATVTISATGTGLPSTGDVLADFSSRGPNIGIGGQLIVKPEISAPGVDILAAYASQTGATASTPNLPLDPTRVVTEDGTSMATPHTAGSGLLLRALHPTWSPVQIRSALMLNAKLANFVRSDGSPTDIFDRGAGRIDLAAAAKTGLLMNETGANFTAANPAIGGVISKLNIPSMADGNCVVSCSFARTVQSARPHGSPLVTWTLAVSGMPAGSTTVTPASIKVDANGTGSFTVTVDATKLPDGPISQGLLTLTPSDGSVPTAHMPIAVRKGSPTISTSANAVSSNQLPNTTVNKTITVTNVGNPTLNWTATTGSAPITLLNTLTTNNGELGGYYSRPPPAGGSYLAQDFDVAVSTQISRLTANGFILPSSVSLTTANTPGVTFNIYKDAGGIPDGNPGDPPTVNVGTAPVYSYTNTIGAANGITTTSGVLSLDFSVGTVPQVVLAPGRYWLMVAPNITSTAAQTTANPLWAWRVGQGAVIGNPPQIIGSFFGVTAWETADPAANNLSSVVAGNAQCTQPTWASFTGMSGALANAASNTGTITFDSTGLTPGQTYTGALCLSSNDTATPIKVIALSLSIPSNPALSNAVATPASVNTGETTLLTAAVAPGSLPASTGVQVRVDLSSIGGSASQPMFDDGTNGDATAGDGLYSYSATVAANVASGAKNLPVTLTDAQSRSASASISLTVAQQTGLAATSSAAPSVVVVSDTTHLVVSVTPGSNPASTGVQVTADLTSIGGSATQAFVDSGSGTSFSFDATIAAGTTPGVKLIPVTISDTQGRSTASTIGLSVSTPGSPSATGIAASALPGDPVLLQAAITPGSNPASTALAVTVDLSAIGGSATQVLYDDGSNGDAVAGDGVYSFEATISADTPIGATFNLPVSVVDGESRTGAGTISLKTLSDRIFGNGFE